MLRSYTGDQKYVNIAGATLKEVLKNLDNQFPGIVFRFIDENENIREHMNLFVNQEQIRELSVVVSENDELFIAQALSGG